MARLPQPGGDSGNWGTILNDYLTQAHKPDGTLKDNVVTSSVIAPNAVTNTALATDSVNASTIADGSISEVLFDGAVQSKLNAPANIADGSIAKTKLTALVQSSLDKADTALQTIPDAYVTENKLDSAARAKLNNPSLQGTALGASENSVTTVQAGTAVTIALAIGFISDGISPTRIRLAGGTYSMAASTTLTWDLYDPLNAQVIRQSICPAATSGVVPGLFVDKVFPAGNCVVQARFKPGSNTTVTIVNALTAPDQSPLQLAADKVIFA